MTMDDTQQIQIMNDGLDLKLALDQYATETDIGHEDNILANILADSKYYNLDQMTSFVKSLNTKKKQFSILHLNIQSLPAKYDKLKMMLSQLQDQNLVLDVILLCETFLHEGNMNLFKLPGYNLISRNRSQMKGGGVAIYIHSNISYTIRDDIAAFVEGEYETVFIETVINAKKTLIGEIYRPPGTNATKSVEYYENMLDKLKHEKQVILGTDSNFNLLRIEDHPQTANFFNVLLANSFLPSISKPTRITEHTATLIDNIFLNNLTDNIEVNSGLLLEDISDHLPIFCILNVIKTQVRAIDDYTTVERRHITPERIDKLNIELGKINWDYLNDMQTNEAYEDFTGKLNKILDEVVPKVKMKIKSTQVIRDPWITKGLLTSSVTASTLYRKSIGKSKIDNAYTNHIQYRNR